MSERADNAVVSRWTLATDVAALARLGGGALLETILQGTQEGITAHTPDGVLLYANPTACQQLALDGTGEGATFFDQAGTHLDADALPWAICAREKRTVVARVGCRAGAGSARTMLEARSTWRELDGAGSVITYWFDVSEHWESEQQWMFHAAIMEAQREVSPSGVVVTSASGEVLYWNQRFSDLWDVPRTTLTQRSSRALFDLLATRATAPRLVESITSAIRFSDSATVRDQELSLLDGRTFECHSSPLFVRARTWAGRAWFFRDLTARKAHETWENEFVAMAAHELRNPLQALGLTAQVVSGALRAPHSRENLVEWAGERVALISRQANRLDRLINRLLDVAALRTGRFELQLEDVNLWSVVCETVELHQEEFANRGGSVTVEGTPVRCRVDRARLEQVVENLLSNAVKYGEGTPIRVRIDTQRGVARITVSDRGPGIPPGQQRRIFDAFHRGSSDHAAAGLGLGLYVVRRIVAAHGGHVFAQSAPGEETSFVVCLPRSGPGSDAAE